MVDCGRELVESNVMERLGWGKGSNRWLLIVEVEEGLDQVKFL